MEPLTCRVCGVIAPPKVSIQQFLNQTEHVRADCPSCGAYIKYLPKEFKHLALPKPLPKKTKIVVDRPAPEVDDWSGLLEHCPNLTKALFKSWAKLSRIDDANCRYLIEVRTWPLYKIANKHREVIEAALNKKLRKNYCAVLFTLDPLIQLTNL